MKLPLYWIDAFTDKVFHGNPAAVVPLTHWLPDALMQRIGPNGSAKPNCTPAMSRRAAANFSANTATSASASPAAPCFICAVKSIF